MPDVGPPAPRSLPRSSGGGPGAPSHATAATHPPSVPAPEEAPRHHAPRMPIASLDHLVLTVADVDRTVSFYEALGMRLERFGGDRIALRFGDQKLNLHEARHPFEPM